MERVNGSAAGRDGGGSVGERVSTDTLVVGAGPIGIEVAAGLKDAGVEHLVIDAGPIGATIASWAPATRFFSSPERIAIAGVPITSEGQDKTTREQYLSYLRQVVGTRGLRVSTFERLMDVVDAEEGSLRRFVLRTERRGAAGRVIEAANVVLAIGDMHEANDVKVAGEDLPHVSHELRDPHEYYGRRVLIIGGRNSAVEAAIRLYRVGAEVSIAYRRATFSKKVKYWLRPELLWLIESGRIGFYPDAVPGEVRPGEVDLVRSPIAEEAEAGDGWRATVSVDDVLMLTGYVQDPTLFRAFGVELEGDNGRPVHDEDTMRTNVPGVYVAGTASAGTQLSGVTHFIETSHVHAERIAAAITGGRREIETPRFALEES